jgi:uncharacterized membrane protein YdjX (TVP38/TMEM64 family)
MDDFDMSNYNIKNERGRNMTTKSIEKRALFIFWFTVTVIPILGIVFSLLFPGNFETSRAIAQNWFVVFGVFGPLFFIFIQALQVIITPISHYTVGVIGGYLYGPWLGGLLNYTGRLIGHFCAFVIARKFGRPLMEKYVDKMTIEKYDHIIGGADSKGRPFLLFLIYFLPLFPDDEISYLAGASKMRRQTFVLASIFGQVGGSLSLAYIGSGISTKDPLLWVLSIATVIGFPLVFWLMRKNNK